MYNPLHIEATQIWNTKICPIISPFEYKARQLVFENYPQCAVPDNIHTPPTEGIGISWGVGGSVRPKNLKKCIKLNWNFQRGGEVLAKIPSMGEVWIFSGTTQLYKPKQTTHSHHYLEAWTLPPTEAMTQMREILKPLMQGKLMKNDMSFHSHHELWVWTMLSFLLYFHSNKVYCCCVWTWHFQCDLFVTNF